LLQRLLHFYIAPQNPLSVDNCDAVGFVVVLVVFDANEKPVLFVKVKDDKWAEKAELRYGADR
jgi:hypothetical protein